jgi:uncharacterized RDD family membrane protein YckC
MSEPDLPTDLPIRPDEPIGPLADLRLTASARESATYTPVVDASAPPSSLRRGVTPSPDLPLFGAPADDAPLISGTAPPRPPLAVRRGAPVVPKPRSHDAFVEPEPELGFLDGDRDVPVVVEDQLSVRARPGRHAGPDPAADVTDPTADPSSVVAPAGRRVVAAMIDAVLIASIDAAVAYFTLKICGLRIDEIAGLPPVPAIAFLLLLNGGYATMFTAASGQTIGKMIARIRVVPTRGATAIARVPFGSAVIRAAAYVPSLLPAGLGFLVALVRADGRAFHDTLADTRVIRA